MPHYVQCPFLLYLLVKIRPQSPPSPLPLDRLGLVEPDADKLKVVSCCFAGYHACRRRANDLDLDDSPLQANLINQMHLVFLDHFCAAALDCGLPTRAFSTLTG